MLTQAQKTTLANYISNDPTLSAFPNNSDGAFAIAALLNQTAAPAFAVWRTDAPVAAILDAIDWTKFTPADTADNTTTYLNRTMLIQVKQMNLQTMLQGRANVDASKANVRAGLRDAVISLPSGAAGAATTAGGVGGTNVLNACTRSALLIEKVLAGAPATTGPVTANLLDWEGAIGYQDVLAARGG